MNASQATLGELLAFARYWLRDIGQPDAFTITDDETIDRLEAVAADAEREGRRLDEHLSALTAAERARVGEQAGRCRHCLTPKPPQWSWLRSRWRHDHDHLPVCPDCIDAARAAA